MVRFGRRDDVRAHARGDARRAAGAGASDRSGTGAGRHRRASAAAQAAPRHRRAAANARRAPGLHLRRPAAGVGGRRRRPCARRDRCRAGRRRGPLVRWGGQHRAVACGGLDGVRPVDASAARAPAAAPSACRRCRRYGALRVERHRRGRDAHDPAWTPAGLSRTDSPLAVRAGAAAQRRRLDERRHRRIRPRLHRLPVGVDRRRVSAVRGPPPE